jgi:D-alanyl-D-alanine carboxypeptidase/D-alanyl-D-alanine-endopeptidase (penicillin-binding protein 4)
VNVPASTTSRSPGRINSRTSRSSGAPWLSALLPALLPALVLAIDLFFFIPPGMAAGAPGPGLKSFLDGHLEQPRFASAAWGVKIINLTSGQTLYERDARKLLKPASNTKLYTAALALERLGPEYRIRTSIYARQPPDARGEIEGDLVVFGRGDPSFAARFNQGSHADNLAPLAQALARAGVKRIRGDLIADESYFKGPPLGSGWMWDDLGYYYGAEVSALTVEDNVVDLVLRPGAAVHDPIRIQTLPATSYLTFSNRALTTATNSGPAQLRLHRPLGENTVYVHGHIPIDATNVYDAVTVHRPALWFGTLLHQSLARHGIIVEGTPRAVDALEREIQPLDTNTWSEIAFVESRPLNEILGRMLKPSQNLYAQLLLLQVGATSMRNHARTNRLERWTEDRGLDEMKGFLQEVGIDHKEVRLEEGSGLSRGTLLTPNATTQLLAYFNHHRHRDAFREALPLAGVEGTLRRRLRGTRAAGNVRAKTGTLRYVYTLSGYVTNRASDELAFSLMLNNYTGEEDEARAALDAIVVHLAESAPP